VASNGEHPVGDGRERELWDAARSFCRGAALLDLCDLANSVSSGSNGEVVLPHHLHPSVVTPQLALDFVERGGKYARPFLALTVYDALTGCAGDEVPRHICQIALAIEIFHKASLVHDDIEDDDAVRYGLPTLHREHGIPLAVNVGDYLIGLGYRLLAAGGAAVGQDCATDLFQHFASAHLALSEGQGAELAWRDLRGSSLAPADAIELYAQKTAPGFEGAMYAGARAAGPAEHFEEPFRRLARALGIAFQIRNDLKDLAGDAANQRKATDICGRRPTVLWALALERLHGCGEDVDTLPTRIEQNHHHETNGHARPPAGLDCGAVQELYARLEIVPEAERLIAEHVAKAHGIIDEIEEARLAGSLRPLLNRLV